MQITLSQEEIEVAVQDYVRRMGITCPVEDMTFQRSLNPTSIWAQITVTTGSITPVEYPSICAASEEDTEAKTVSVSIGPSVVSPAPTPDKETDPFVSDSKPKEVVAEAPEKIQYEEDEQAADAVETGPSPTASDTRHSLFG